MEADRLCPSCVLYEEHYYGRAGFSAHGRVPSGRYSKALAILDAETAARLSGKESDGRDTA